MQKFRVPSSVTVVAEKKVKPCCDLHRFSRGRCITAVARAHRKWVAESKATDTGRGNERVVVSLYLLALSTCFTFFLRLFLPCIHTRIPPSNRHLSLPRPPPSGSLRSRGVIVVARSRITLVIFAGENARARSYTLARP